MQYCINIETFIFELRGRFCFASVRTSVFDGSGGEISHVQPFQNTCNGHAKMRAMLHVLMISKITKAYTEGSNSTHRSYNKNS